MPVIVFVGIRLERVSLRWPDSSSHSLKLFVLENDELRENRRFSFLCSKKAVNKKSPAPRAGLFLLS
jgi:hypothetical protein